MEQGQRLRRVLGRGPSFSAELEIQHTQLWLVVARTTCVRTVQLLQRTTMTQELTHDSQRPGSTLHEASYGTFCGGWNWLHESSPPPHRGHEEWERVLVPQVTAYRSCARVLQASQ